MKKMIKTPELKNITVTDPFIGHFVNIVSDKLISYQWDILNDRVYGVEKSYVIDNFKKAAGIKKGEHQGAIFCDTDAYKWIETVAYCIMSGKAQKYEVIADDLISLIAKAQQDDGYLDTYFILSYPSEKWKNLAEGHELYGAGHLIEAAVAYYQATNKRELLNVAIKYADLIYKVFVEEGNNGYPGHQEIELALVKLSRVTGDRKYMELAKHFIDIRGNIPNFLMDNIKETRRIFPEFVDYDEQYAQSHMKPINQTTAEGHAVRAMYMYCAMADIAGEYQNETYRNACEILWENIAEKRMYITGGIGSSGYLERFTTDYDLPNDRAYCESCASVGLMMFGQRMAMISGDSKYYDVVERALCNTVLGGMAINGDKYFYVNPLEVWPQNCLPSTSLKHVKSERQPWFACACCPPNIARTLASIGQYIYAYDDKSIYINQYIDSTYKADSERGKVSIEMTSEKIDSHSIKVFVEDLDKQPMILKLRIPGYLNEPYVKLDGEIIKPAIENGYAIITLSQNGEHVVLLNGSVEPRFVSANDKVRSDVGKISLMYGPYVYCLEEVDNGKMLTNIYVDNEVELRREENDERLPKGLCAFNFKAKTLVNNIDTLYGKPAFEFRDITVKSVPYCLWCNREPGEMLVWMNVLFSK